MPVQHLESRRGFVRAGLGAGVAGVLGRCAAPAAPAPAPPLVPAPSAPPAWQQEWDRLVAAARQEGRLSAVTLAGVGYRKAFDEFEKAFPGITVELHTFTSSGLFAPKVLQERKAGVYPSTSPRLRWAQRCARCGPRVSGIRCGR
ncbi:MAG: hypothetical protein AAB289_10540 [Chloroflexota bacterium]